MSKNHYDLIVIGSGPAGEKGAAQAAYFGKKVAIIEKSMNVGGTMANHAIPGKGLRETSLFVNTYTKRNLNGLHLDIDRNPTIRDILHKSSNIRSHMSNWVKANLEKHSIDVFQGMASFKDPRTIDITNANGTVISISGDFVLIATGSKAAKPDIFPFEAGNVYHSDSIFAMTEMPKSITIVGAGTIGCEYACIFNHLNVDVTVINPGSDLFPFADQDVIDILLQSMTDAGVTFYMSDMVSSVESDGKTALLKTQQNRLIQADVVLVAVGRTSNTDDLNLEHAHLQTTDQNLLKVNKHFQTDQPHIYAAGDVIGFPSLASTAMEQSRTAVCHAFNFSYKKGVASLLPLGIWTMPEISMVGETEKSLSNQDIDYVIGRARYKDNPRGMAIGEQYGMLKLIFAVVDERLLGVHIIGENACELISPGLIAMTAGATCSTFIDTCFNFPSLSDMYKYATYDAMDKLNRIKSKAPLKEA